MQTQFSYMGDSLPDLSHVLLLAFQQLGWYQIILSADVCEQLAQGCYGVVEWPGV